MRVVAILAGGGGLVAGLHRQAVNTGAITGGLPGVANRAIDRLHGPVVVGVSGRDVSVAIDATVGRMDRRHKRGLVHEQ